MPRLWKTLRENTIVAVFEDWIELFRLDSYSTNAPIEQVLIHWEDGHLLPSKKQKKVWIVYKFGSSQRNYSSWFAKCGLAKVFPSTSLH